MTMFHQTVKATLATLMLFTLTACGDDQEQSKAPPPPTVTVATPLKKTVTEWDEYVGRFQAVDAVDVRARVSGYIESIHFTDGQLVDKGQLLFVIDQRPFKIAVQQAEATLTQSETRLQLAEQEFDRAKPLVNKGTISRSTFDERMQALLEAKASIRVAEAAVAAAKLDLDYTSVQAPVTGRISRRLVSEGSLITGGSENATVMTNIASMDPIYFYFNVSETDYLKYTRLSKSGDRPSSRTHPTPVLLSLLDENDFRHEGLMNFIENVIDSGSGTIAGRALLPNPDGLFIPGLFGKVRLSGSGDYEALLVPDNIVGSDQSQKFVMAVDDAGKVLYRPVTLGPMIDGLRVIKKGISENDRLIINGLMRARPGMTVTPSDGDISASKN